MLPQGLIGPSIKVFNDSQGVLVCGGDMNMRLSKTDSSTSDPGHSQLTTNKVNSIMKELGAVDVWRDLYQTSPDYALFSAPRSFYSTTEYCFLFLCNYSLRQGGGKSKMGIL